MRRIRQNHIPEQWARHHQRCRSRHYLGIVHRAGRGLGPEPAMTDRVSVGLLRGDDGAVDGVADRDAEVVGTRHQAPDDEREIVHRVDGGQVVVSLVYLDRTAARSARLCPSCSAPAQSESSGITPNAAVGHVCGSRRVAGVHPSVDIGADLRTDPVV